MQTAYSAFRVAAVHHHNHPEILNCVCFTMKQAYCDPIPDITPSLRPILTDASF